MRDVTTELKELRLHGMVGAWTDLVAQGAASMDASRWLIEHLLQAEHTDRAMRSVSHQMNAAKFPMHRDSRTRCQAHRPAARFRPSPAAEP